MGQNPAFHRERNFTGGCLDYLSFAETNTPYISLHMFSVRIPAVNIASISIAKVITLSL